MTEEFFVFYISIALLLALLVVLSLFIPFIGFIRKRWKGLAIGCLIQPVICVVLIMLMVGGSAYYNIRKLRKQRKAAMVTVRKIEKDSDAHYWYLKAGDECFYEFRDTAGEALMRIKHLKLFDVVREDSNSVCVDDKIFVRFDLKNRRVTATEYEDTIEVINVDWEKVERYFGV